MLGRNLRRLRNTTINTAYQFTNKQQKSIILKTTFSRTPTKRSLYTRSNQSQNNLLPLLSLLSLSLSLHLRIKRFFASRCFLFFDPPPPPPLPPPTSSLYSLSLCARDRALPGAKAGKSFDRCSTLWKAPAYASARPTLISN